jgi:hypothetical protein
VILRAKSAKLVEKWIRGMLVGAEREEEEAKQEMKRGNKMFGDENSRKLG